MVKVASSTQIDFFKTQLQKYKSIIDQDIEAYGAAIESQTAEQFGEYSLVASSAYTDILRRGGKRIRGALVMTGYFMCGGKNEAMILEAARAIEMMHAYILIIDDIQDRSVVRRGGPTAHIELGQYHKTQQLSGDGDHFGVSIALNAALLGPHAANMLLANLDAAEEDRLKAISILNRTMVITAHGQTNDIFNEVLPQVSDEQLDRVLEWKTAYYTFINPLQLGMVLAGASCEDTDAITPYALNAGYAFQISDDILGIFGTEAASGKSPLDDIREGKRTILTNYALKHAPMTDKNFLLMQLGNSNLTQAEFGRCQEIILDCGALDFAKKQAEEYVAKAIDALNKQKKAWRQTDVKFLSGLAEYLVNRKS